MSRANLSEAKFAAAGNFRVAAMIDRMCRDDAGASRAASPRASSKAKMSSKAFLLTFSSSMICCRSRAKQGRIHVSSELRAPAPSFRDRGCASRGGRCFQPPRQAPAEASGGASEDSATSMLGALHAQRAGHRGRAVIERSLK